jgi:hypothetical protein
MDPPFKLLPIKRAPTYSSPPRAAQALRPELLESPGYSPARPVPEALLRPSPLKNGLNMRGKGGSYKYQAPEEIERSEKRNTLNERNRELAQSLRSKLIFDPNYINRWERGDPYAHQRLANLGRAAAGEKPLEPLPFPPPPPIKPPRQKPISFDNNNNNNNNNIINESEPVTAPAAPKKSAKRPRNNNTEKIKKESRRKTRRLKNRRHK